MKSNNFFSEYKKELIFLFLFLLLDLFAFVLFTNVKILGFQDKIYELNEINEPQQEEVMTDRSTVMIFGGGIEEDGTMSTALTDRVIQGVKVYRKSPYVDQILITGDDGQRNVNEVSKMKRYAVKMGVATSSIKVDGQGYGTYESCYRASNTFGIKRVTAVSQEFHLPRIIYSCSSMGIDTIGVGADLSEYEDTVWTPVIREMLARGKAWLQVEIVKPDGNNMWEVQFGL